MRTPRRRRSDLKLVAASALLVLAAGALIAGGIYVATRQDDAAACGVVNAGDASELRRRVEADGPTSAFNVGAGCSYILALDGDDLVAVRPVLEIDGETCSLQWRPSRGAFSCGGETVALDALDRYETGIGTGELTGALIVDLSPTTTTTRPG